MSLTWQNIVDFPTSRTPLHFVLHRHGIPVGVHFADEHCPCKPTRDLSGNYQHRYEPKDIIREGRP